LSKPVGKVTTAFDTGLSKPIGNVDTAFDTGLSKPQNYRFLQNRDTDPKLGSGRQMFHRKKIGIEGHLLSCCFCFTGKRIIRIQKNITFSFSWTNVSKIPESLKKQTPSLFIFGRFCCDIFF